MSRRHTISINDDAYTQLKRHGKFGESYGQLISRLVSSAETSSKNDVRVQNDSR